MLDIASLIAEHDRLAQLSERLLRIATSGQGDATDAFLALRELACELDTHLAGEDGAIYAHALGASGAVARFEAEFADLTAEWATYLREWTLENIHEDWDGFAYETARMMGRLTDRIAAENRLLLPLALKSGALRLKAA